MRKLRRHQVLIVTTFLLVVLAESVPIHHTSSSINETQAIRQEVHHRKRSKIWRVTKYASLLGPTTAMFLYEKMCNMYQKNEPFLRAMVEDYFDRMTRRGEMTGRKLLSLKISQKSRENVFALSIARDIIRITNRRLRERTAISRMQMDDDEYDVSRRFLRNEIRDITRKVTDEVLNTGSGKFLTPKDEAAVRVVVSKSLL